MTILSEEERITGVVSLLCISQAALCFVNTHFCCNSLTSRPFEQCVRIGDEGEENLRVLLPV